MTGMSVFLFGKNWVYMPIAVLHCRSLNHTQQRAMDAAIARAPVQICDVNSEQPTDLFCKKSLIYMYILQIKRLMGCVPFVHY